LEKWIDKGHEIRYRDHLAARVYVSAGSYSIRKLGRKDIAVRFHIRKVFK